MTKQYDVIIVGASAAGLVAAITAAHGGARVALLEKLPRAGKKLLATGNGRCNLSNTAAARHDYRNADFAAAALAQCPVSDTLDFFRSLGLLTYTDSAGRIYPMSNTASSVSDALRAGAAAAGVSLFCGTAVVSVTKTDDLFAAETQRGEDGVTAIFHAPKLILATGGKAAPKQGSDGSGYALARQLGHSITPLAPSLVPLVTQTRAIKPLKGLRVHDADLRLTRGDTLLGETRGEILFTDYGLSGIAAMELSRCAAFSLPAQLTLDLLPALTATELRDFLHTQAQARAADAAELLLSGLLPKAVGLAVYKAANVPLCSLGDLHKKDVNALTQTAKAFPLPVTATKDFAAAQVTAGGVSVTEFHPQTLESRICQGLYCAGEILDIDGGCGGFNLQWAWSSGMLCGQQV